MKTPDFNVGVIIPTGVGASIGGFGGDGMTVLSMLSGICDTVITHPNVANAACFQKLPENALYVEGYALDQFFRGEWNLQPVRQNKIGVIWDSGIPDEMRILHQNTINAVKTVYGVDIVAVEATSEAVDIRLEIQESGRSAGRVNNAEVLLAAARSLMEQGATALAVCCLMPVNDEAEADEAYKTGEGIDPIGGIEAMISHMLVAECQIPVAHAPIFAWENAKPVLDEVLDPRAASEFIVPTFLPCVLTGLSKAPQYAKQPSATNIPIEGLSALLVPVNALGNAPVLACIERGIPVIGIENNLTVMEAWGEDLGFTDQVVYCTNYLEAIGYLVSLKQGIHVPPHLLTEIGCGHDHAHDHEHAHKEESTCC